MSVNPVQRDSTTSNAARVSTNNDTSYEVAIPCSARTSPTGSSRRARAVAGRPGPEFGSPGTRTPARPESRVRQYSASRRKTRSGDSSPLLFIAIFPYHALMRVSMHYLRLGSIPLGSLRLPS